MTPQLLPTETKLINDAVVYLENPSLLMRLTNIAGRPLERLIESVDKIAPDVVENTVNKALQTCMSIAVHTIPAASPEAEVVIGDKIGEVGTTPDFWHKVSVAVSGTAGGFFGLAGLPIELPVTTTIMFRSIAAIAKEFGENLDDPEIRLQCLSVFCFGGPGKQDDAMESTYLTARLGIDGLLRTAARSVAGLSAEQIARQVQKGSANAVVNFIAKIASQFNIAVTEKLVVQALPVLGAVTGATINVAFIDHFNRVAKYHFGIRCLERKYGVEYIQSQYREVARSAKNA
jgi:hypothetical protein